MTNEECSYISTRVAEIAGALGDSSANITVIRATEAAQSILETVFVVKSYPTQTTSQQKIIVNVRE